MIFIVHTTDPSRVLAIFDLDKTIINTSASLAYSRPLAAAGLISKSEVLRMMTLLAHYMLTTHSEEDMNSVKNSLLSIIKDRESATLRNVAEESLHTVITPYIYAEARELLQWHREQGHTIAIVTASPDLMAQPLAEDIGADILIATELEEQAGRFTGEVVHFNKGSAKVEKIAALAAAEHYDLTASYAYSDSGTDAPMLAMVGHPTAVNPDRALRKIAAENDWPIRSFSRPEPLHTNTVAKLGAGAGLAIIGVAAGFALWLLNRGDTPDAA